MKVVLAALFVSLVAHGAFAADPVYLDEVAEMPLTKLQQMFPDLRKEGCYQVGPERFVLVTIDKKDQKPWRVILASTPPCRHATPVAPLDLRARNGVELGTGPAELVGHAGKPDTAARPDESLRRFGDMEYFYICRISEGCARHTSVFLRDGTVSAIAEWYSE
ncbi:MAG: hypothetical protein QOH21_3078 [Acidobacteriota bacterium]|jgi:hypothetical protein|nr:hypothetical protein [Acidobacteriota bacterium]